MVLKMLELHFKPALTERPLSPLLQELAQAMLPQMLGKKCPNVMVGGA